MIANARMYSVTPHVATLWRRLLGAILAGAEAFWRRHPLAEKAHPLFAD
jgi:hypothetical protein